MMWYELERQVFDLTNDQLAKKLIREGAMELMYLRAVGGTDDVDDLPPTEGELDQLSQLLSRADQELGGE